jgi:hypothetical protein
MTLTPADYQYWVQTFVDEILSDDVQYVISIMCFVLSKYENPGTNFGAIDNAGDHGLIKKYYQPADVRVILEQQYRERKGRMVVAGMLHAVGNSTSLNVRDSRRRTHNARNDSRFRAGKPGP